MTFRSLQATVVMALAVCMAGPAMSAEPEQPICVVKRTDGRYSGQTVTFSGLDFKSRGVGNTKLKLDESGRVVREDRHGVDQPIGVLDGSQRQFDVYIDEVSRSVQQKVRVTVLRAGGGTMEIDAGQRQPLEATYKGDCTKEQVIFGGLILAVGAAKQKLEMKDSASQAWMSMGTP